MLNEEIVQSIVAQAVDVDGLQSYVNKKAAEPQEPNANGALRHYMGDHMLRIHNLIHGVSTKLGKVYQRAVQQIAAEVDGQQAYSGTGGVDLVITRGHNADDGFRQVCKEHGLAYPPWIGPNRQYLVAVRTQPATTPGWAIRDYAIKLGKLSASYAKETSAEIVPILYNIFGGSVARTPVGKEGRGARYVYTLSGEAGWRALMGTENSWLYPVFQAALKSPGRTEADRRKNDEIKARVVAFCAEQYAGFSMQNATAASAITSLAMSSAGVGGRGQGFLLRKNGSEIEVSGGANRVSAPPMTQQELDYNL